MKKRVLIGLILIMSTINASPGLFGGRGIFRVEDVKSEGQGMLSLSVYPGIYREFSYTNQGQDSGNYYKLPLRVSTTYAPLEWLEVIIAPEYDLWTIEPSNFPPDIMGFNDTRFGFKLSLTSLPVFKIGLLSDFYLATQDSRFLSKAGNKSNSFDFQLLTAFDMNDVSDVAPFNFILNTGYRIDKYLNDRVILGFGTELPGEWLGIMAELYTMQGTDSLFNFNKYPLILSPGVKFYFPIGFGLSGGIDLIYSGKINFRGNVGINLVTEFLKPPPPPIGYMVLTVMDTFTGKPLPAIISFPDTTLNLPVFRADRHTGIAKIDSIRPGVISIKISAKGYRSKIAAIPIEKDQISKVTVMLLPENLYGSISGTVKDAKTGKPLKGAKIIIKGKNYPEKTTDEAGFFRFDSIKVGVVFLQIAYPEYINDVQTVQIEMNKTATIEAKLRPALVKGIFFGQVLDRKSEKPLKATITFVGTSLHPVKTNPQTGVFKAELPAGTYEIMVSSEGYISQPGAIVIKEDGTTEKNFRLVKKGMTFTFHNILFDFNKATLKPESYPVLDKAAEILKENPNILIEVQGHTDSVGNDAYNLKLSQRRAEAVVTYLINTHHINPKQLIPRGYGETRPIASNTSESGRAQNRRVEFVILGQIGE